MTYTFIATTIMGLESVLAKELKALDMKDVQTENTRVRFKGTIKDLCRANLWLRTAGRVFVEVGQFKATSFDELFDKTKNLPWEDWIGKNDQFPISKISAIKSIIYSKSDSQAIVKKAIVDRLKKAHGVRSLPETQAPFPIRVHIEKDLVSLSIDTSGTGLNKRGYRAASDKAPLRETLAAGMILLSNFRPDQDCIIDPLCGSGTLLIEAGLIAKNIAPGLNRSFVSQQWACVPNLAWRSAVTEAKDKIIPENNYRIYGSDNNYKALSIANENIKLAGLSDIFVQKRELSEVASRFDKGKIITNPPYGERLSEQEEVEALYQDMGQHFKSQFSGWSYYIITPDEYFEELFGLKATKKRKLFNGGSLCWYYQFWFS